MESAGCINPVYRLAGDVQVRKESWGLLFYAPAQHQMFFVKSGGWLYPQHFDGTWAFGRLVGEIAGQTGMSAEAVERSVLKLTLKLVEKGILTCELC